MLKTRIWAKLAVLSAMMGVVTACSIPIPGGGEPPRVRSRARILARIVAHRNAARELEREQERALLLHRFGEERAQDREEEDETQRHSREPRGDDAVVPDEVHGSRDGRGLSLRHHERRVEPSARGSVRAKPVAPSWQTKRTSDVRVGFRIFRG